MTIELLRPRTMAVQGVNAYTEDFSAFGGEFLGHSAEALDLSGTNKGKVRGIEKQDEPFALVSRQRVIGSLSMQRSLSGKLRRFISDPQKTHLRPIKIAN
jgi:hypothetical protein